LLKRRELPCANFGGTHRPTYRISRADLDAWVKSRRVEHGKCNAEREALVNQFFHRFRGRK
jgi:hypothetical protein